MLVRFSSTKTESIMMFGDDATRLIRMLGATGNIPGAISAEDIPPALTQLRQQLQRNTEASVQASDESADEEKEQEPPIALATRAMPLIDILERSAQAKAPVMWERV